MLYSGYLSTRGSQIVDAVGLFVRIVGINWTTGFDAIEDSVAKIAEAGFNTVRVPWTNATMTDDMARIDKIADAAGRRGLMVILDHHTDEAGSEGDGWGAQQKNGLPYDVGGASDGTNGAGIPGTVSLEKFVADWVSVATRYAGNNSVVGFDLVNEPLRYSGMSTWGDGNDATDLTLIYKHCGDAIHAVNPYPLIICQGPQNYAANVAGSAPAPWGDLSVVREHPVVLNRQNKVVYSVHDYPSYISGFTPDSGDAKIAAMTADWGYLVKEGIAPVLVGEMGANLDGTFGSEVVADSEAWATTLLDYMNGKLGNKGGPTFSANQQGVSGCWSYWACFDGAQLNGIIDKQGNLRQMQRSAWSQLARSKPAALVAQAAVTPAPAVPPPPVAAGALGDASGNKWSITSTGQISINGSVDTTTADVIELAYVDGTVWQRNGSGLWYGKSSLTASWSPPAGTKTSPFPTTPTNPPQPPPPPTQVPSIVVSFGNETIVVEGPACSLTASDGTSVSINAGLAKVKLGTTVHNISCNSMNGVEVTGGRNASAVEIDAGKNTFIAGRGSLTVTAGTGSDTFRYSPSCGLLTIVGFKASPDGDVLKLQSELKGAIIFESDGSDGTKISFGTNAEGIVLRGIKPNAVPNIVWT